MRKLATVVAAAVMVAGSVAASPAQAVDKISTKQLRDAVTVGGILSHERVLQRIANQNGGTRASGTPGFAASAQYVSSTLKTAGYSVKTQNFTFPFFRDLVPATLSQTAPTATDYETETFQYSGSGDVTGTVVPTTAVQVPPAATPGSLSGCEPGDFPAAPAGPAIALIQRGTCTFGVKAANAEAAGYEAAVIFNEGQEGRTELLAGTLGTDDEITIPVVGLSYADGAAIFTAAEAGPVTLHVTAATEKNPAATTSNVIAETKGGDANNVIVVGAHLDSVVAGPGINDNGSGSATILEIAKQISALKIAPRQKVRFIFFGAEESGLLGSYAYVDSLTATQLTRIKANLNFDMLGSPNYARFVYDGDGSSAAQVGGAPGPAGSGAIEKIFTDYFTTTKKLATTPTAFDGRSDYGPFIEVGIPAGGLFSGAEGVKTKKESTLYGGVIGAPYDSCYHQACDTVTNLSTKALDELGDAAAHAVLTLALSKTGLQVDGSFRTASGTAKKVAPAARSTGHVLNR